MPIYNFNQDPNYREVISFAGIRLVLEYRQWHSSPWSAHREFCKGARSLATSKSDAVGKWILSHYCHVESKIHFRKVNFGVEGIEDNWTAEPDKAVDLLHGDPAEQEEMEGHGCPHAQVWLAFPAAMCSTCGYGRDGWLCACGTVNEPDKANCGYCSTGKTYQWSAEDIKAIPDRIKTAKEDGRFDGGFK